MNFPRLRILALGISLFFYACGNDDGPSPINVTGANTMSANIGGNNWTNDGEAVGNLNYDFLTIGGSSPTSQISITISPYTGSGTYEIGTLNATNNLALWSASLTSSLVYSTIPGMGSGAITITERNGNLAGEFYFNAVNPQNGDIVAITNGTFDVQLN